MSAWRAVPIIVLLITFLIGCIIAQQGLSSISASSEPDVFVVDMVGILVLRELGVLIVCDHGGRPLWLVPTPPNSVR